MANALPHKLEQVRDYSSDAAIALANAVGNQRSNAGAVANLLSDLGKVYDKDQMAKAAAIQDSMVARGLDPDSITSALYSMGFGDKVIGSKELQDRYLKSNQAYIAKTSLDNTLREQELKKDALALAADLDSFIRTAGTENASIWHERNKDRIAANPYAAKEVKDYAKEANLSFTPYTSPDTDNKLTPITDSHVASAANMARERLGQLAARGVDTTLNPDESVKLSNVDAWIDDQAKIRGYNGTVKYTDFRENMYKAYNYLQGKHRDLPPEVILQAMKMNMDNGGIFANWFGLDQENIDTDAALTWIDKQGSDWYKGINEAFKLKKAMNYLEPAVKDNTISTTSAAVKTREKNIRDMISKGILTAEEGRAALNNYISKVETSRANINQAIKDILENAEANRKR